MLQVVTAPDPVLSTVAQPVKRVDNEVISLIAQMKKTLASAKDPQGVGLAAPQVGKSLRIFFAKPSEKSPFLVFINPVILSKSQTLGNLIRPKKSRSPKKLEGCLSLPNIWGTVLRHKEIKVQYQLITNNHQLIIKVETFSGFLATIIQHEIDHLDGVLFPKRVLEQHGKLYKSHKNKKGEEEFEPLEI